MTKQDKINEAYAIWNKAEADAIHVKRLKEIENG